MTETDKEARIRQWKYRMRDFEKAQERERQERRAFGIHARAIWANICAENPHLRVGPAPSTYAPTRSAIVDRKVGAAPWAVREIFGDGRAEWYRVADGAESGARDLAERLRKTSQGRVEAMQLGGGRTGRGTTRRWGSASRLPTTT